MKTIFNIACVVLLGAILGCGTAYNPMPEGYSGPTFRIDDTYNNRKRSIAHYYVLSEFNGNGLRTSWSETRSANYGKGLQFEPSMVSRELPVGKLDVTISALRFYSTDAEQMFGDVNDLSHTFSFTPKEYEIYKVRGDVSNERTSVWLEDSLGNRIEGSYLSLNAEERKAKLRAEKKKRRKEKRARKKAREAKQP